MQARRREYRALGLKPEEPPECVIYLFSDQLDALAIFIRSKPDYRGTMSGLFPVGYTSTEFTSVAKILKIDIDETLLDQLRDIESGWLEEKNKQFEKKVKRV